MSAGSTQINGHTPGSDPSSTQNKIQPADVGWQFVPQYYNFVNKQPHRLHCFYNKRSTFIHGEEGEEAQVAYGQQEIHDRITAIGYDQCKVYIHSIDSQSSANGGIIILVIGELSNKNQSWRKFSQTFFLAEQPNGYFVLNDIFRYLKEEVDEDEEDEEQSSIQQPPPVAEAQAVEVVAPAPTSAPAPVEAEEAPAQPEEVTQEPASAPEPEPEPVQAPAHPDASSVPEEANIAAIPDKDVAPSEPAPAVEEAATTAADPPIEEAPKQAQPAASPVPTPSAPKAAAPSANGTNAPPPAPAAPAKPSAPKSWASMAAAAGGKPAWGAVAAPAAPAPAAPAPAPAPKKEEPAPAPAAASSTTSQQPRHPFYENAMRVQTPHCFVKLPNWSPDNSLGGETIDEATLRTAASRFGDVAKVEIVKHKACAFVEFAKVESARKAIVASLSTQQGGEGGVKVGSEGGKLNFETRKERDERRPKGPGGGSGRGGATGGERGGRGGSRIGREDGERPNGPGGGAGRGRGRGRGGMAGGAGERAPSQQAVSK